MKKSEPSFINRLLLSLLRISFPRKDREYLWEEYREIYREIQPQGKKAARRWLRSQIWENAPSFLKYSGKLSWDMQKSTIKAALRFIKRQKGLSLVNLSALSLGLTGFLLAFSTAYQGFHYDRFHRYSDRIYGVIQVRSTSDQDDQHLALIPSPMAARLQSEFPEIEETVQMHFASREIIRYEDKKFYEDGIVYASPNFLNFFSFELTAGEPDSVLKNPGSLVLTESAAEKYFGEENPLGKTLLIGRGQQAKITGVLKKIPLASTIRFDFLLSSHDLPRNLLSWEISAFTTFIRLKKNAPLETLNEKFPGFLKRVSAHLPDSPKRLYVFALTDFFHRNPSIRAPLAYNSPAELYIALVFGTLILLVAGLNYTSLSTAQYLTRIREVGVRKVLGANRRQLRVQFLGESVLTAALALPLSMLLYEILGPLSAARFAIPFELSLADHPHFLVLLIGAALIVGLLSGAYPALMLSGCDPAAVLYKHNPSGKKGILLRRMVVLIQFSFAGFLIYGSLVTHRQFKHLTGIDLGFNRDQVLVVRLNSEARQIYSALKSELQQVPEITAVSAADHLPYKWPNPHSVTAANSQGQTTLNINCYAGDYDYLISLGIELVQGRGFSREFEDENSFLINQTAARELQWDEPLGQPVTMENRRGRIIGVTKDFHFTNLIYPLSPALLYLGPNRLNYLYIRIAPGADFQRIENLVESYWNRLADGLPFNSFRLKHGFNDAYLDISAAGDMFRIIGLATVLFACLGMLALISFVLIRKTKEIGIRKIMGASSGSIFSRLLRENLLLVILANLFGLPPAVFVMNSLMSSGYAYSPGIAVGDALLVAAGTILIAGLAVYHQSLKAARTDPVESLRYE